MVASILSARLRDCLNDADFPAGKNDLVEVAVRNGCPDAAQALRGIPPETYANMAEVLASVTLADDSLGESDKAMARRTHTKPGLAEGAKDIGTPSPIVEELGENRDS
jgi:hypothetical protein